MEEKQIAAAQTAAAEKKSIFKKPTLPQIFLIMVVCGFLGMSCGPLMKMQMNGPDGLSALWVACLRGLATWILFWPIVIGSKQKRQELKEMTKKEWSLCLLSGLLLGFYFLFWVLALKYSSSFNTVTVICVQFIFIALLGYLFFKEKISKYAILGGVAAFTGIFLIGYSDFSLSGEFIGTLIAVASAFCFAAYLTVGKSVRKHLSVVTYSAIINTVSAVFLLVLALIWGGPLRALTWGDIALILVIMVFGSGAGHVGPNWAVKFITSEILGIVQLLNPVYTYANAAIVAALFNQPAEIVPPIAIVGCAVIVLGIAAYMYLKNRENKRLEAQQGK